MSDNLSLKGLVSFAAKRSVLIAYNTYKEWSGGISLGGAPESFVQIELARSLASFFCLTLEQNIDAMIEGYKKEKGFLSEPNKHILSLRKGRIDIVCWEKASSWQPAVLIEVKRSWDKRSINNDALRLATIKKIIPHIKIAMIVAITDASREQTIERLLTNMETEANWKLDPTSKNLIVERWKEKDAKGVTKEKVHWSGSGCYLL